MPPHGRLFPSGVPRVLVSVAPSCEPGLHVGVVLPRAGLLAHVGRARASCQCRMRQPGYRVGGFARTSRSLPVRSCRVGPAGQVHARATVCRRIGWATSVRMRCLKAPVIYPAIQHRHLYSFFLPPVPFSFHPYQLFLASLPLNAGSFASSFFGCPSWWLERGARFLCTQPSSCVRRG